MTSPEIVLTYANDRWRARGSGVDAVHAELRGIERLIEAQVAGRGVARVAVRFDLGSLPAWMRQYQSHYFNYELRFEPRGDGLPPSTPGAHP